MTRQHLDTIHRLLGLQLAPTLRGSDLKGQNPSKESVEAKDLYLDAWQCEEISQAFAYLALQMKTDPAGMTHRMFCGPACPQHDRTGPCDLASLKR